MKLCFFKHVAGYQAAFACCGIILLGGCGIHRIPDDVSGTYVCATNGVIDTLVLNTNGDFQQTITSTNGHPWILYGSWKRHPDTVVFSHFYDLFDFDGATGVRLIMPPMEGVGRILNIVGEQLGDEDSGFPMWTKETNSTSQP